MGDLWPILEVERDIGARVEQNSTRLWRRYLIVVGTIIGIITAVRVSTAGNETVEAVCGLVEVGLIIAHIVALQVGVRRHKPRHSWPWHMVTLSPVLVLLAVVADTFNRELTGNNTFPAPADFLFLLALVPALLFFVAANHYQTARADRSAVLDASMIATAAALLAWSFIVAPHVDSDALSPMAKFALFSLPVLDVVCVWLIARLALGNGQRTVVFFSILAADSLLIVTDSVFTWLTLNNQVTPLAYGLSSSAWDLTYLLVFSPALHPKMRSFIMFADAKPSVPGRKRLVLISAAALIAPAVALFKGGESTTVAMIASIIMFGLVVLRMEGMLRRQESTSLALGQTLEKLQTADIQLRHAQKLQAVGRLAAGVAHEINTPIQATSANVHFLQSAFKDMERMLAAYRAGGVNDTDFDHELLAEVPAAIDDLLRSTDQVATIVKAMKSFGDPANSDRKSMDLNNAVVTVLAITENQTRDVALVETRFEPGLQVNAVPGDINEVLLNLVTNAVHAIQDRPGDGSDIGHITIDTATEGSEVVITVSDNGAGIPAEIQPQIFDPFFTTKTVGRGSGQGLAIAWNLIVDRHHGSISVKSELGVGTAVIVRIPAARPRFGPETSARSGSDDFDNTLHLAVQKYD